MCLVDRGTRNTLYELIIYEAINFMNNYRNFSEREIDMKKDRKFNLLLPMYAPSTSYMTYKNRELLNNKLTSHKDRTNVVFIGDGKYELNYSGMKWFDEEVILELEKGIPGIKCLVIGPNWDPTIFKNQAKFQFLGELRLHESIEVLDRSLAFVMPVTKYYGLYAYSALAMERGLPIIATTAGAQSLCKTCDKLQIENPMDPFAEKNPEKIDTSSEKPLLVATFNKYDFVEKVKKIRYEPESWSKYSNLSFAHGPNWFSQYAGAKAVDSIIEELFRLEDSMLR